MKRFLSIIALAGLSGLGPNLAAQATQHQPDAAQQQQQPVDTQNQQQAARSFEGKIAKAGSKLVLQETTTQTAYQLDDQDKAKQFAGKNVKVMATVDPSSNTLHIVDIAENR